MAGSVNKVMLLGNLGKDPEIRMNPDGGKMATFTLATNESWKDKNTGERRDRTEWHRVVIFNDKLSEIAEKYLKKGSKVYVEGQLQTRKWTDQQGQEKYTTEVILSRFRGELTMLDTRAGGSDDYGSQGGDNAFSSSSGFGGGSGNGGLSSGPLGSGGDHSLNDEVPF